MSTYLIYAFNGSCSSGNLIMQLRHNVRDQVPEEKHKHFLYTSLIKKIFNQSYRLILHMTDVGKWVKALQQ